MSKVAITQSDGKETKVNELKEIKYQNILGEEKSVTDFSTFNLNQIPGSLTFVGNSIFSIRSKDIVSVHFEND